MVQGVEIKNKNGISYREFDAERYKDLAIRANVEVSNSTVYSERERTELLLTMFEKGIINREQLLTRLPDGVLQDKNELLNADSTEVQNERI